MSLSKLTVPDRGRKHYPVIQLTPVRVADPRPHSQILINGISTEALWDTGSAISLINVNTAKRLKINSPILPLPSVTIKSASGHPFRILGFHLLAVTVNNRTVSHPLFVLQGVTTSCILGADFMTKHNLSLTPDFQSGKETLIPRFETVTVTNTKNVTIPPRSEVAVRGRIEVRDGPVLVQRKRVGSTLAVADDAVVNVVNKESMVVVSNPSPLPIHLSRSQPIATIQEISSEECVSLSIDTIDRSHPSSGHNDPIQPEQSVDLSNIPAHFKDHYRRLVRRFQTVINDNATDIGRCRIVKQAIRLKDPSVIASTPPYQIPPALQPVVHHFVDELLNAGIIRKSNSPFSSPLMLVKKANADKSKPLMEQYRVVNDFRKLNANTVRDSYPMQNLYELIDDVANSNVASVIDLRSAFFLQELEESSRKYTSFPVPGRGLFEYCRSPQGLVNSPSTFQRLLDQLFADIPNVKAYIDDIVVYDTDHVSHLQTLQKVFSRLEEHGFKCSSKKVQLACGKLNYLGYEIEPGKAIRPGVAKTEVIKRWIPPVDITGIKSFLGLCSFFRRTIPNFASIAAPLNRLTRKTSPYVSGPLPSEAHAAFVQLKQLLTKRPCLKPVSFDHPFILTTDASETAVGAVLSQLDKDGHEHPCAFYSRALNDRETKWAPYFLEHLAMVTACRHFRPYLIGKHFTLRTDHKPLLTMNKVQGNTLDRMRAELEDYDFTVEYMRGADMIADGLSRLKPEVASISFAPLSTKEILRFQKSDVICKSLLCALWYGTLPSDPELRRMVKANVRLVYTNNGILYTVEGDRLVAPVAIQHWLLAQAHDNSLSGHSGPERTLKKILQNWFWPSIRRDVTAYCRACHECAKCNLAAHARPGLLKPLPSCTAPFDRVHMDLLQLPTTATGFKYVVVIIDAFSRWVELIPIRSKEALPVAEAIITGWVCRHGAPRNFTSDLGKEFTNAILKEICKRLNIEQMYTTPGHPASNGMAERVNRKLLNYLRKYHEKEIAWEEQLPYAAFALNTTFNESTGYSPFYVIYGNDPVLPYDLVVKGPRSLSERPGADLHRRLAKAYETVLENNHEAFIAYKRKHDKRAKVKRFRPNDRVYLLHSGEADRGKKLRSKFEGPYFVVEVKDKDNVIIRRNNGRRLIRVNSERLKLVPLEPAWIQYSGQTNPVQPGGELPKISENDTRSILDDEEDRDNNIDDIIPDPLHDADGAQNVLPGDDEGDRQPPSGHLLDTEPPPSPPPPPPALPARGETIPAPSAPARQAKPTDVSRATTTGGAVPKRRQAPPSDAATSTRTTRADTRKKELDAARTRAERKRVESKQQLQKEKSRRDALRK